MAQLRLQSMLCPKVWWPLSPYARQKPVSVKDPVVQGMTSFKNTSGWSLRGDPSTMYTTPYPIVALLACVILAIFALTLSVRYHSFFCLYIFFGFCITQYKQQAILIYSQYYQWNRGDACISYGWINIIINPSQITVILKIAAMLYLILLALAPVAVTRNFTEKKTVSKPVVGIISVLTVVFE